eukprot:Nk52_evm1s243 gene=Nk52_evmTU1s243
MSRRKSSTELLTWCIEPFHVIPTVRPHHLDEHFQAKGTAASETSSNSNSAESFIVARKKKLAERLAYVRKVMLQQKSKRVQLAEKIKRQQLAAEKNREHSLRKISSRCSEKVDRAKRVSRQQKIQDMSLRQAQRENILKRMNESTERREKLLRKGKGLFDAQGSTRKNAAIKIQSWLRACYFSKVLEKFRELDLDTLVQRKSENQIDFATMSRKLISRHTIGCSKELFAKLCHIDSGACKRQNVSRVFLSAYMIVACPESVFSTDGDAEHVLKKSASDLIQAFRKWIFLYKSLQGAKYFSEFAKAWKQYRMDFDDWKQIDQSRLVDGLVAHYMELEALKETVSGNPETEAHWFPNIEAQQEIIYKKLLTLGSNKAIRRLKKRKSASGPSETQEKSLFSEEEQTESELDTSCDSSADPDCRGSSENETEEVPQLAKPTWHNSRVYPDEFGSNENISLSDGLTNEKLAHELAINPAFRFARADEANDEKAQIRAMAKEQFRVTLSSELSKSPPDLSRVPKVLDDIRKLILDVSMGSKMVSTQVNEALDIDLITQQIAHGAFDMEKCLKYICTVLSQLCAPVRDARIGDIFKLTDPTSVIVEVFEVLSLMKLDLANYHIETILPYIQMHSVEYERKKFQDRLDMGEVSLNLTSEWLRSNVRSDNGSADDYEKMLSASFVKLLFSISQESSRSVPETYAMDAERLLEIQRQLNSLIKVEAVITVVKTVAPALREEVEFLRELKENLLILLNHSGTSMKDIYLQMCKGIQTFEERTWKRNIPESSYLLMKGMILKIDNESDTIRKLITQRVSNFMECVVCLSKSVFGDHKGSTSLLNNAEASTELNCVPEEKVEKLGLVEIKSELFEVSEKARLLFSHNKRVYAPFYDKILRGDW